MNNKAIETSKLAELQQKLPQLSHAAAQAVCDSERRLAQVLTLRAAGLGVGRSEVSSARMAYARALRDVEDLRRIQATLSEMLQPVPETLLKVARAA